MTRLVRALFGDSNWRGGWTDLEGGVGVREPRRPLTPSLTGTITLDLPVEEGDDSR